MTHRIRSAGGFACRHLRQGFGMIELGIVIAIVLAVLAGVVFTGLDYFNDARYRRVGDEVQLVVEAARDISQGGGYPGDQAELTNAVAGRVQESMQSDPNATTGRHMVVGGAGGYPVFVEPGQNNTATSGTVGGQLSANTTRQFLMRVGGGTNKVPSDLCTVLATRDYLGLQGVLIQSLPLATLGATSGNQIRSSTFASAAKSVYTYRGSGSSGTAIRNLRDRRLYANEVCDGNETAVVYFLFS